MTPAQPDRLDRIETALEDLAEQVKVSNQKIDALQGQFNQKFEALDYKFDTYQKASDGMTRMATTIIITAGAAVILAPAVQAIAPALKEVILGLS